MSYVFRKVGEISFDRVLEVGSYDENGSVREVIDSRSYIGLDVRPGPGVDLVMDDYQKYPFADNVFALVVSTECLEHDLRPWRTVAEMVRVAEHGGIVLVTARGYDQRGCYEIHDWRDCWRFSVQGMEELLTDAGLTQVEVEADPDFPGVFAKGIK